MLAANPGLVYWNGGTTEAVHCVRELRRLGTPVFFTVDAGPQLKAICPPDHAATVGAALRDLRGVAEVLHSRLGPGARVIDPSPA
jgi:diphosphomevalonate decarboxylase